MKHWLPSAVASLALGLAAQSAFAQPQIGSYYRPQVNPRPTVSPYLNIYGGGNNPAVNYYGIVRPQIETSHQLQQLQHYNLQQATQAGAGQQQDPQNPNAVTTGAGFGGFFYYGNFYPLFNRQRSGGSAFNNIVRQN